MTVIWTADMETGDFSQWEGVQQFTSGRSSVVTSPIAQGSRAMRMEARVGEFIGSDSPTRNRCEAVLSTAQNRHNPQEGSDWWYIVYIRIPASTPLPPDGSTSFQSLMQWITTDPADQGNQHGAVGINVPFAPPNYNSYPNPPTSQLLYVDNNSRADTQRYYWYGPHVGDITRDVYHKLVMHRKWSVNESVGFVEIYWNDVLQTLADGSTRMASSCLKSGWSAYWKVGTYRSNALGGNSVIYYDGVKIATTRAEVDPAAAGGNVELLASTTAVKIGAAALLSGGSSGSSTPGSSGPLSAGTGADDSAVGTLAWQNPGNVTVSDNTYAAPSSGQTLNGAITHYLKATNFGFAIPSDATIKGIIFEFERFQGTDGQGTHDSRVRAIKGGTILTTDKATGTPWPNQSAEAYQSYGSSTDLWGGTWLPADINAVDFGVAIAATNANAVSSTPRIDHIRATVHYTTPVGGTVSIQGQAAVSVQAQGNVLRDPHLQAASGLTAQLDAASLLSVAPAPGFVDLKALTALGVQAQGRLASTGESWTNDKAEALPLSYIRSGELSNPVKNADLVGNVGTKGVEDKHQRAAIEMAQIGSEALVALPLQHVIVSMSGKSSNPPKPGDSIIVEVELAPEPTIAESGRSLQDRV